jgi:hypothetical protein
MEKDKAFLENFEREMLEYDEHLTMTLDVYLEYLRYCLAKSHLFCTVTMVVGPACL